MNSLEPVTGIVEWFKRPRECEVLYSRTDIWKKTFIENSRKSLNRFVLITGLSRLIIKGYDSYSPESLDIKDFLIMKKFDFLSFASRDRFDKACSIIYEAICLPGETLGVSTSYFKEYKFYIIELTFDDINRINTYVTVIEEKHPSSQIVLSSRARKVKSKLKEDNSVKVDQKDRK